MDLRPNLAIFFPLSLPHQLYFTQTFRLSSLLEPRKMSLVTQSDYDLLDSFCHLFHHYEQYALNRACCRCWRRGSIYLPYRQRDLLRFGNIHREEAQQLRRSLYHQLFPPRSCLFHQPGRRNWSDKFRDHNRASGAVGRNIGF